MSYCTTGWMAVTTLTHRVTVMMMPMMMMMMIQAPLGSLFFSHTHRVAHHTDRPDKARPSVQWKGRGRPAVGRVARLLSARWWAVALPPTSTCDGLVWSGLVCERPRLNQRRHERGFPRSCITTCDTSYNCTRAGRQVVRRVGRLVETAAAQRREKEACELDVLRNMKLPPSSSLSSKRLLFKKRHKWNDSTSRLFRVNAHNVEKAPASCLPLALGSLAA